jgi:SSS family transporter
LKAAQGQRFHGLCFQAQVLYLGLAGVFWFTLPNILCFFVFVPIALKLRKEMPKGVTLAEYFHTRFKSKNLHKISVFALIANMVVALVANSYAGGTLLNALTGIETSYAIVGMMALALAYSLIGGLKASIFTDIFQMIMVLGFAFVLVPFAIYSAGGFGLVEAGLSGISGEHGSIFNPAVAFAMGIPMSITLLTGPVADQMFVQRVFAVKKGHITRTFVAGGLIFGLVPITLSLLGFLAVSLVKAGALTVASPEMVGPAVIAHLLPEWALYAFLVMALAGLCSTLDSALCAVSALGAVDIYKRYIRKKGTKDKTLFFARRVMCAVAVFALGISLLKPQMLWTFFVGGAITSALFFPVIFSLFVKRISAKLVFTALALSLCIAIPFAIYSNVNSQVNLVVYASLLSVFISLPVLAFAWIRK